MKKIGERGFEKTRLLYLVFMSIYELADKLYGAIHIAYMRLIGLTLKQISQIVGICEILLAVFDFPTGAIADKIGRKKIAAYGFLTMGIGFIIYANSSGFWMVLLARAVLVLGVALLSGAPSAWLVDKMISEGVYDKKEEILPKISGVIQFFSIIASIIAFFIIEIDVKIPLILAGIFSLMAGVIALCFGEDNYGEIKEEHMIKSLFSLAKSFFKDKKLVLLSVRNVAKYIIFVCFVLYWQIQVTEKVGLGEKYLPILLTWYMICLMVGSFSVSYFIKKTSGFKTSIMGVVLCIVGFIVILVNTDVIFFIIGSSMIEYGFGVEQSATGTWMCDFIKSEVRSTYSSIFSTINAICGFGIINLLGVLTDAFGLNSAWIVAIIVACIDICLLLVITSKCRKMQN